MINGINEAVAQLDLLPGVDVFDFAGLIRGAVAEPGKYGLANATLPCGFIDVYTATGGACTNTFLFWDGIHPTSAGHQVIANAMIAFVPEPSTAALFGVALFAFAARRRVASTPRYRSARRGWSAARETGAGEAYRSGSQRPEGQYAGRSFGPPVRPRLSAPAAESLARLPAASGDLYV